MSEISAIIPVYNEEKTIRPLILELLSSKLFYEIILINDGSTDSTLNLISELPIKIISHKRNLGKDRAIRHGVSCCRTERILLLDGDLIGLRSCHLQSLLNCGKQRMVLGIIKPRNLMGWLFFLNRYYFTLTGIRLVNRNDILDIESDFLGRYRLESILANRARKYKWPIQKVLLSGIRHVSKEEKVGWKIGLLLRLEMLFDILLFYGQRITK